jgi:uncharacterized protein (UPF0335 family)
MRRQPTISSDSIAQDQLRAFFERIERLHEERAAIGDDIKEVFAEAKGNGFDTKVMKIVLGKRRQDHAERMEQEALVELYMAALGMAVAPRDDDDEPRAPAPARAREIIEEFDAETGEIIEPAASMPPGVVADQGGEGADPVLSAKPILPQTANEAPSVANDANAGGENVDASAHRAGEGAGAPSPAPSAKRRNWEFTDEPHPACQRPQQCGGYSNSALCPKCKEVAGLVVAFAVGEHQPGAVT